VLPSVGANYPRRAPKNVRVSDHRVRFLSRGFGWNARCVSHYAGKANGGARGSAMSRELSAQRLREMTASAIPEPT
jgi:hypothetical protein